jgi:hypothetical protein
VLFDRRILKVANINAKAEGIENKPAFREAFQTAEALPVDLQQPTYLQTAGTAGQCQERPFGSRSPNGSVREGFRMPARCERSTWCRAGVRKPPKNEPAGEW